jgi:hypothetical protein
MFASSGEFISLAQDTAKRPASARTLYSTFFIIFSFFESFTKSTTLRPGVNGTTVAQVLTGRTANPHSRSEEIGLEEGVEILGTGS